MFETLGHYRILDRIGAGGMGEVYRARDTRLGRTVAIKVLPAELAADEARRERLLREARAAAALSHPNIAALYEIGEDQGHLFLVFEFVPGKTLKTEIGGRPINPRRAIEFAIEIADALADAHAEGVIHRDIKPDNIIITPKEHAKILDFGLATWTGGGAEREQAATMISTGAGAVLGTVAYMSPEQALGEQVDQRTDIFSLGIVLFEMITGRLPFSGATSTALALQIVQAQAPAPSSMVKGLQPEVDAIVVKALAKSIDQRYESAATFSAELRAVAAILDVRSDANPPPPLLIEAPPPPSHPWIKWVLAALILVALGLAAVAKWDLIRGAWARQVGSAPPPVIAVIPLELAGGDNSQTFFADGLTEDLITRLGQTPGLKVFGRSATREYRNKSPRDVARDLGASVVLTGSVRPSGDTVKVSLELVNPADGQTIWSNQYTRELKDIFQVQAQVADEVAAALRVKLTPTPARARAAARTVDPRAYETYSRARQAMDQRRLPNAIALFQQAIAADAGLAEAHAGLAEAMHLSMVYDRDARLTHFDEIKAAAERAYQIDPDLPQANVALGLVSPSLATALQYMRHAVDVDPTYGDGYHQIADAVMEFDVPLAISFWKKSLAVDPGLAVNHMDLAEAYKFQFRWDDARREIAQIADPALKADVMMFTDLDEHRFESAIAAMESKPSLRASEGDWSSYILALATANRFNDALNEATQGLARFPDSCSMRSVFAGISLDRGQIAAAHRIADPILKAAEAESSPADAVRCAVIVAAAMRDGQRLAALLDRIAAREDLLRYWALGVQGFGGGALLQGRQYPFIVAITDPVVAPALKHLDEAHVRMAQIARAALAGLP